MQIVKISAAILTAAIGFTALASTSVQAEPRHWFYNDYDRYDREAEYYDRYRRDDLDDEYYDQGYQGQYAPAPRRAKRSKWEKREKRLRKWAKRLAKKAFREKRRKERRRAIATRESLYDARNNEYQTPKRAVQPAYISPKRSSYSETRKKRDFKLAYVPLPRTKPYHLIPNTDQNPISISLAPKTATDVGTNTYDERPRWKATQDDNIKLPVKKGIEVTALPEAISSKEKPTGKKIASKKISGKKPDFKPIRIEVVKKKNPSKKPRTFKPKLSANQLSCKKAESIVSEFGFSDITPRTCNGSVYDFNAKRDGKPYSVKVSSLSGELKGVKRIK